LERTPIIKGNDSEAKRINLDFSLVFTAADFVDFRQIYNRITEPER
jgi:hypothetical protein